MGNPFFQAMGGQQAPGRMSAMNPMSNLMNMLQQFSQTFSGDPKTEVEKLLQSGQMSQEQFKQYQMFADKLVRRPQMK